MKVRNMTSSRGNKVANQFIITSTEHNPHGDDIQITVFQSYETVIVQRRGSQVYLDRHKWDYSKTTGKYRNQFLGESKRETEAKIKSGEYILADLN